jgi:nitrate reductase gamma subunit
MLRQEDNTTCLRCHVKGNQVDAVAMILPPKSVICMPCHAATFSVGDFTTILALIIFLIGVVFLFAYVLSGSMPGIERSGPLAKLLAALWNGIKTVCSPRFFPMLKVVVLEGLLQRRLFRQSRSRWLIHGLIFWPFVFRFSWGLVALGGSIWMPERSFVWPMLDKNDPATALLFDLSGMMVIIGLLLAFVRGRAGQPSRLPGQPRQDRLALGLIAAIVVIGFVLEGMRIAMTGRPEGSGYAVVGYAISTLFSNPNELTDIYGIIWYIHALLTGAFVAYLPFSRLLHVILAPIVLAMNGAVGHKHERM